MSQELLLIALTKKTARVTRTSFEAVYQQQFWDVYTDNFFLIAAIVDSTWNLCFHIV